MSYTPFVWHDGADGGTLVTAARLNALEQGLAGAGAGGNPFSVKQNFGAAGDGTSDDTTKLNAAFAAGGLVYLDPGDYKVTAQLYVYGTTKTVVTGPGRIVSTYNGAGNAAALRVDNAAHVIDGITVLGGGATLTNQGGIAVDGDGITVTRCQISNIARYGIYSTGDNVRILDNVTDQTSLGTLTDAPSVTAIFNSGDGVRIEGNTCTNTYWGIYNRGVDATNGIDDGIIVHNRITMRVGVPIDAQGISSAYPRHQKIAYNTIAGYTDNCIDQYGGRYSLIEGNTCADGGKDGIFVGHGGTWAVTIVGNNINGCTGAGVRVWDGASRIKVASNNIFGIGNTSVSIGIRVEGSLNAGESDVATVDVQGNVIDGNYQTGNTNGVGIFLRHVSAPSDVSGNTIRNVAREGIYADNVDIITVRNNRLQDTGRAGYPAVHTGPVSNRVLIDDNVAYGTASPAIRIESGTGHRAAGNRWRNITTGISDTATATVLADNTAF